MTTTSIFISSVQKDLAEERRALEAFIEGDALLRRYFTAFLFEGLPASDRLVDDVYLEEVDRCAVYVGLFGTEYGFEDREGVSPTEREFDRALRGRSRARGGCRRAGLVARDPRRRQLAPLVGWLDRRA